MITKETILKELEKQLLANGLDCEKILFDCSMTTCGNCALFNEQLLSRKQCWKIQKELAKTVRRKLLLKKLLDK